MEHKKKYHGKLSLLFGLLFCLLLSFSYITIYAGFDDPFTSNELAQINDFFNLNISLSDLNWAYNEVKNRHSGINKLNITFLLLQEYSGSNYSLFILPNNGTFSDVLNYLTIYRENNTTGNLSYFIDKNSQSSEPTYFTCFPLQNGVMTGISNSYGSSYSINSNNFKFPNISINGNYLISDSILTTVKTQTIYFYDINTSNKSYFSSNYITLDDYVEPEPEQPSGDSSGDDSGESPSGDISGDSNNIIDYVPILDDINTNITNQGTAIINNQNENTDKIVNALSGETNKITNTLTDVPDVSDTKITSGDIEGALGFEFVDDPYANFWFEMTQGLSRSLTGSVRQLPINWLGYQGVFDLDNLGFNYPASVRLILTSASTISIVWILVKWWKIIIDKLTSGNMDEVLAMNEEERYC